MKAANPWENIPVMTEAEIEALERGSRTVVVGEPYDRTLNARWNLRNTHTSGRGVRPVDFHLDGSVPEERK